MPGDIDDIQDAIIGGKHGDITFSQTSVGHSVGTANWAPHSSGGYMLSSGAGTLFVGIPLAIGDRIKQVTFDRFGDDAADLTSIQVVKFDAAGVAVVVHTTAISDLDNSWITTTLNFADYTLLAGEALNLQLTANAANIRIGNVGWTKDRP